MASSGSEVCRGVVYTVGHSNRSLEEFIRLLERFRIVLVVDVRRWPTSRRFPWFERRALESALRSRGIAYAWLGDLLGGFRPGGYEAYMASDEYRKGIEVLRKLIDGEIRGYVAIMCRERLWFRCHRRFIADTLASLGYRVIHIVDESRTYVHRLRREGDVVSGSSITSDM